MAPRVARLMLHVCFLGVESTGKSMLAERLAPHLGGIVMPEYGREYAETISTDFTPDALRHIAREHAARLARLRETRPPLLVEDTDVVMTAAWFRMLHGARDPEISAIPALADLHLLFAPDTPWVDDGTRQFVGQDRLAFQAVVEDELAARGIDAVLIAGTWDERRARALRAITRALEQRAITRRLDKAVAKPS
ncbi:AAA family ATPase [Sandarakinorhabdus sp.]|uniref:AAA family ATPase n=1 Tax=Sandarakinorhabdus sp. TaxID=1916663 RepID=UPI003F70FB07